MRNFLCIALLLTTISCKKESSSDLFIKNKFITQLLRENENISDEIMIRTEKLTSPTIKRSRETVEKMTRWKQEYLKSRSRKDLLIYTDSILNLYRKSDYTDSLVVKEIETLQVSILSSDSTSQLNLLYWDLFADKVLLEEHDRISESDANLFRTIFPTYINSNPIHLGDTVYVALGPDLISNDSCYYDFSRVECKNVDSGDYLTPKIIRMIKAYLLIYVPHKKGNYILHGDIILTPEPGYSYSLKVHNTFQIL